MSIERRDSSNSAIPITTYLGVYTAKTAVFLDSSRDDVRNPSRSCSSLLLLLLNNVGPRHRWVIAVASAVDLTWFRLLFVLIYALWVAICDSLLSATGCSIWFIIVIALGALCCVVGCCLLIVNLSFINQEVSIGMNTEHKLKVRCHDVSNTTKHQAARRGRPTAPPDANIHTTTYHTSPPTTGRRQQQQTATSHRDHHVDCRLPSIILHIYSFIKHIRQLFSTGQRRTLRPLITDPSCVTHRQPHPTGTP